MIELPEAYVLAKQINETLKGKQIQSVRMNQSPHKFAWFNGNPDDYEVLLKDKVIDEAVSYNGLVEIKLGDVRLLFGDGVHLRYFTDINKVNLKNQMLIVFTDSQALIASIQMYGGIWAYKDGEFKNQYYLVHKQKSAVYSDAFNYDYFNSLITDEVKNSSVKEVLATNQRIPGLGNGILQDILYNANIHPKRKLSTLSSDEIYKLFQSIKNTINDMIRLGGRDTEKDLFGNTGQYKTKVSKNTVNTLCPICQSKIEKEAYLGGSIYYCAGCQQI